MAARKATEQPKYRDRASERRTLFNQPDTPMPDKDASSSSSARKKQPTPPPPPPPPPVNPGKDESNVGNKLLKMMGWKEGSGLGTEGEGRVDPMLVFLFVGSDTVLTFFALQRDGRLCTGCWTWCQQRQGYRQVHRRAY